MNGVSRNAPGTSRIPFARVALGGAAAVALWCMLLIMGLLPGVVPDGWAVLGAACAGAALGATRFAPLLLMLLVTMAAGMVIVVTTPIADALVTRWARNDPLPDSAAEAAIALSAGVTADTTMSGEALDHLMTALELIRAGKAGLLVTTTVERGFPYAGYVSTRNDQARVIAMFGGSTPWIRTGRTHTTREEAIAVADSLRDRKVTRVLVVASALHTRRACASFEAVGFTVTCVAARSRQSSAIPIALSGRDRLVAFGGWLYELAAMAKYRASGWLDFRAVAR